MKNQVVLIITLFTVAFLSCEKTTEVENPESEPRQSSPNAEVKAENGMLVFSSHSHFMEKMIEWNGMDRKEVDRILGSFDYDSYYSDTTIDREVEVTPDLLLQKVINNRGAVKVNDSLFVLTPYNDIIIKGGDMETYQQVLDGNTSASNVEKFEVINTLKSEQSIDLLEGPAPFTWYGEVNYLSPEENNGRPERVRVTLYAQTRPLYPSCGLYFRGEAYRRCGLWCVDWRRDEVSTISVLPVSTFQTNFFSTVYTLPPDTVNNIEDATIFSYPGGGGGTAINGDHFGFQNLAVHLSFKKRSYSPTRNISLYVSNGVLQPAITNW